ncbi:hypothetical protein EYC80_000502 [Monilinia laxa]|uniref:Uncharacterized protein n=1 Tax=Monilinia laxa TaxID=61186 RepID=A0A5N6KAW7_MONLA|nr:hypothetical protein EYC80_000502 [Monilinia laxa]
MSTNKSRRPKTADQKLIPKFTTDRSSPSPEPAAYPIAIRRFIPTLPSSHPSDRSTSSKAPKDLQLPSNQEVLSPNLQITTKYSSCNQASLRELYPIYFPQNLSNPSYSKIATSHPPNSSQSTKHTNTTPKPPSNPPTRISNPHLPIAQPAIKSTITPTDSIKVPPTQALPQEPPPPPNIPPAQKPNA